jgi:hypothetical protein
MKRNAQRDQTLASQSQQNRSGVVTKAVFASIMMMTAVAILPVSVDAQQSLNQSQAALYLACVGVGTGGTLSPSLTPNTVAALLLMNQQTVSQAQSIPSLQGLTFIQLGQAMLNSMNTYEKKQLGCQHKCVQAALNLFQSQSRSSCLSIASGFAP